MFWSCHQCHGEVTHVCHLFHDCCGRVTAQVVATKHIVESSLPYRPCLFCAFPAHAVDHVYSMSPEPFVLSSVYLCSHTLEFCHYSAPDLEMGVVLSLRCPKMKALINSCREVSGAPPPLAFFARSQSGGSKSVQITAGKAKKLYAQTLKQIKKKGGSERKRVQTKEAETQRFACTMGRE